MPVLNIALNSKSITLLTESLIETACFEFLNQCNASYSWKDLSVSAARVKASAALYKAQHSETSAEPKDVAPTTHPSLSGNLGDNIHLRKGHIGDSHTEPPGDVVKALPRPFISVADRHTNGSEVTVSLIWGMPAHESGVHPAISQFEVYVHVPRAKSAVELSLPEWHRIASVKPLEKDMGLTLSHLRQEILYKLAVRAMYVTGAYSRLSPVVAV